MKTTTEIKKALKEAIGQGLIVEFYYYGGIRRVEPYSYGIHKVTGNEVLSAYQVDGFSKSKNTLRWRLYLINKIKDFRVCDEKFDLSNRPRYAPNDSRMSIVYCAKK